MILSNRLDRIIKVLVVNEEKIQVNDKMSTNTIIVVVFRVYNQKIRLKKTFQIKTKYIRRFKTMITSTLINSSTKQLY